MALPYSAGQAPVKKSELSRNLLFKMVTGPPPVPGMEKWLGLGMLIPSMRYKTPAGVFPRTTKSLRWSSEP